MIVLFFLIISTFSAGNNADYSFHKKGIPSLKSPVYPPEEESKEFWFQDAHERIKKELEYQPINKQAKNIIIFLGDGMGVSTLTAAR